MKAMNLNQCILAHMYKKDCTMHILCREVFQGGEGVGISLSPEFNDVINIEVHKLICAWSKLDLNSSSPPMKSCTYETLFTVHNIIIAPYCTIDLA